MCADTPLTTLINLFRLGEAYCISSSRYRAFPLFPTLRDFRPVDAVAPALFDDFVFRAQSSQRTRLPVSLSYRWPASHC